MNTRQVFHTEIDTVADAAAAMDAKRDALIERLWLDVNWNCYEDLPEIITSREKFDDAFKRYLKGDFSHLNALCDEAKEFVILREAEKILSTEGK